MLTEVMEVRNPQLALVDLVADVMAIRVLGRMVVMGWQHQVLSMLAVGGTVLAVRAWITSQMAGLAEVEVVILVAGLAVVVAMVLVAAAVLAMFPEQVLQ